MRGMPRAGAAACHLQTHPPNKRIDRTILHASARDMDRSSLRPPIRPLVGVTACFKENGRGGWHHTVGDKYVRAAIHAVGGLPVLIPAIGPELGGDEQATIEALDRLADRTIARVASG